MFDVRIFFIYILNYCIHNILGSYTDMVDIQAMKILTERKKVHDKYWNLLISKQKSELLNLDQEILSEFEETSTKIYEIRKYIFIVHAEMKALVASQKSFTIQLCEEMEWITEEGLLEGKLMFRVL